MQPGNERPQPPPMPGGYPPPPQQQYYQPPPPPSGKVPTWLWILLGVGCGGGVLFIAVMAAILFPVFSQARTKARQTSCMSNLKQLSLGTLMYVQDYDEMMPPATQWVTQTTPYVKNDRTYRCPLVAVANPRGYGYAFNSNLSKFALAKINQPYATGMLFESANTEINASDPLSSVVTPYRHDGFDIFAYVDGHVKSIREGEPIPQATP